MNNLMNNTDTMSSLEIAELTGKQHSDVLKDVRRILTEVDIDHGKFSAVYKGGNGQDRPCYNLPRRECDLVVSGYVAKYRLAIIDRWQELEVAKPQTLPQTLPEALRAYADEVERHEETKVQLESTSRELEYTSVELEAKSTQLDQSKEYFSIKRVAANNGVSWQSYKWRTLIATGAPYVKIFDANYGKVNAYHLTAWKLAYPEARLPF